MIKHMGERNATDSAELISILKEMILDAANEPPYASPYIRTATINYKTPLKWETTIELNASPNPMSLAEFAKKVDKSIDDYQIQLKKLTSRPTNQITTPDVQKRYNQMIIDMKNTGCDPISGSVEHQPTSELTVRCIISMIQKKS